MCVSVYSVRIHTESKTKVSVGCGTCERWMGVSVCVCFCVWCMYTCSEWD